MDSTTKAPTPKYDTPVNGQLPGDTQLKTLGFVAGDCKFRSYDESSWQVGRKGAAKPENYVSAGSIA